MNISSFLAWFVNQFIRIGTNMLSILDNIVIVGNVTLMDFIITLVIMSAFLEIILTIPNTASRVEKKQSAREEKARREESKRWNSNW